MSRLTSSFTCQLIFIIITILIIHHSFTLSLQTPNLHVQQIFPTLKNTSTLDCLHDHRTYHDRRIVFSSFIRYFLFVPCGRLATRQLFTAHLVYSIVWYRIVDVNSMLQLVNVAFQFMCIMSGSVET